MLIEVSSDAAHPGGARGKLTWNGRSVDCALGRAGIRPEKREGDGATPAGTWPLRRVLYRADRLAAPATKLSLQEIKEDDGWCDDPARPEYNRPVTFPFEGSAERLWREDALYDVIVVIGHNDDPPAANLGSAVFVHVAETGYAPTGGCVALALGDLLALLADAAPGDSIAIMAPRAAS